jgi:asparagine synthase (glutamine-hydrolysing)
MCGIAGIFTDVAAEARRATAIMVAALSHRGPDGEGAHFSPVGEAMLGVGHRRLAVRDRSEAGSQPMVHPDSGAVLVYNGELYALDALRGDLVARGVTFRGHSDTEVLLHGLHVWGPEVLRRCDGMFAFAHYEPTTRQLLLARDPLGIKPLYWTPEAPTVAFASEVRALVRAGAAAREISTSGLAGLLAFGAPQEPHTVIAGIRAFPAGTWARLELEPTGRARVRERGRHWRFPEVEPALSERAALPLLRETLEAAVRDQLVSDVPVGVFLSSGIDSTLVAALAARSSSRLQTYTVGFADESPSFSESPIAAATARRLGAEHTDLQLGAADAAALAEAWLASLDQPCVDGLNTFVISRAVRRAGLTVALSGLGGDELFGGYRTFRDVVRLRRLAALMGATPPSVRRLLAATVTPRAPRRVRDKLTEMLGLPAETWPIYLHRRRAMTDALLSELGHSPGSVAALASHDDEVPLPDGDTLAEVSRCECVHYLRSTLLRDADANGMAHGLEIRPPLLDRRVLELAHRIPGPVRMPALRTPKHLLRRAFAETLGPAVLGRSKRGFWLPVHRWMAGTLRERCEAALAHLGRSGLVEPAGVRAVWERFLAAPDPFGWSPPWTLVVLGTYLEQLGGDAARGSSEG